MSGPLTHLGPDAKMINHTRTGVRTIEEQMARRDWHRDGPDVRLLRSRTCVSIPMRR